MISLKVEKNNTGKRADIVLVQEMINLGIKASRSLIAKFIPMGVQLKGDFIKSSHKLNEGDVLTINIELLNRQIEQVNSRITQLYEIKPIKGELDIIYEDDDILVINKQAGISVHPSASNFDQVTIANFIRNYLEEKDSYDAKLQNAGVVHRLDKAVSGLIIWAKNLDTQIDLRKQFKDRNVTKIYLAEIERISSLPDLIKDMPYKQWINISGFIQRDQKNRSRRTFTTIVNKNTENQNSIKDASLELLRINEKQILVHLLTGRNHQIRATLRYLGYFIIGDLLYKNNRVNHRENVNYIGLKSIFLRIEEGRQKNKLYSIGYDNIISKFGSKFLSV